MSDPLKAYIRKWLFKADEDMMVVDRLMEYEIIAKSSIGFHCQQAAEKYLKAFLIFHGKKLTKTHNLEFLIVECSKVNDKSSSLDPHNLTDFGVEQRYPGDFIVPSDEDIIYYREFAEDVKKMVLSNITFID